MTAYEGGICGRFSETDKQTLSLSLNMLSARRAGPQAREAAHRLHTPPRPEGTQSLTKSSRKESTFRSPSRATLLATCAASLPADSA